MFHTDLGTGLWSTAKRAFSRKKTIQQFSGMNIIDLFLEKFSSLPKSQTKSKINIKDVLLLLETLCIYFLKTMYFKCVCEDFSSQVIKKPRSNVACGLVADS